MAADENNKSGESGATAGATTAATAGATEIIKRKRGRPAGSTANASGENRSAAGAGIDTAQRAELQAQFDALYDPKVWKGLVAAPANIAMFATGSKVWDIPEPEIEALAIQASVTARCFAVADPKYLALTMLAISIITIYGGRTLQYFSEKNEIESAKGNKRDV